MIGVSHHEPGVRLGVDACPGVDERGHGLTMTVVHDSACCREWESGQASTPARAASFRDVASRWGSTWPKAEAGPEADSAVYGPQEPTINDLWTAQAAPHDATLAGCSDAEYDRLVLEKQQTEAAYLEGYDRDFGRAVEAKEAEAGL